MIYLETVKNNNIIKNDSNKRYSMTSPELEVVEIDFDPFQ